MRPEVRVTVGLFVKYFGLGALYRRIKKWILYRFNPGITKIPRTQVPVWNNMERNLDDQIVLDNRLMRCYTEFFILFPDFFRANRMAHIMVFHMILTITYDPFDMEIRE